MLHVTCYNFERFTMEFKRELRGPEQMLTLPTLNGGPDAKQVVTRLRELPTGYILLVINDYRVFLCTNLMCPRRGSVNICLRASACIFGTRRILHAHTRRCAIII